MSIFPTLDELSFINKSNKNLPPPPHIVLLSIFTSLISSLMLIASVSDALIAERAMAESLIPIKKTTGRGLGGLLRREKSFNWDKEF